MTPLLETYKKHFPTSYTAWEKVWNETPTDKQIWMNCIKADFCSFEGFLLNVGHPIQVLSNLYLADQIEKLTERLPAKQEYFGPGSV